MSARTRYERASHTNYHTVESDEEEGEIDRDDDEPKLERLGVVILLRVSVFIRFKAWRQSVLPGLFSERGGTIRRDGAGCRCCSHYVNFDKAALESKKKLKFESDKKLNTYTWLLYVHSACAKSRKACLATRLLGE